MRTLMGYITLNCQTMPSSWTENWAIDRHADEFSVSGGGLKSTHTGNTRGPPGVWNCNPDDPIW